MLKCDLLNYYFFLHSFLPAQQVQYILLKVQLSLVLFFLLHLLPNCLQAHVMQKAIIKVMELPSMAITTEASFSKPLSVCLYILFMTGKI